MTRHLDSAGEAEAAEQWTLTFVGVTRSVREHLCLCPSVGVTLPLVRTNPHPICPSPFPAQAYGIVTGPLSPASTRFARHVPFEAPIVAPFLSAMVSMNWPI